MEPWRINRQVVADFHQLEEEPVRICIKVKSWIRIRNKMIRIRKLVTPDTVLAVPALAVFFVFRWFWRFGAFKTSRPISSSVKVAGL